MADNSASVVTAVSEERTPEISLFDHVERVTHARGGRFAVMINLSMLSPHHRRPHHIRIASRTFDSLLNTRDVQLYVLGNGDIALMCKDILVDEVDDMVDKLRLLFRSDPLTARGGSGDHEFTNWYNFEAEFDSFLELTEARAESANKLAAGSEDASAGRGAGAGFASQPLDPYSLAKVDDGLLRLPVVEMMREQPAVIIGLDGTEDILFQEQYVSIAALQRRLAPGFNLVSNPWLFQHLTETIDKRVMAVLARAGLTANSTHISLNLNVKSVLSKDFQRFDDALTEQAGKIVVELQQIDVFSDIENYTLARNWLRDRGYRVLLDGLNPLALQYFDPGLLDADYYKVSWGTEFIESETTEIHEETGALVEKVGRERFILGRTDSETAMAWALTLGIRRFQGFFIDRVVEKKAEKSLQGKRP
jgi:EAL domain-containing protein (putative c-di-GMP-specific phosphodiesterase class I)